MNIERLKKQIKQHEGIRNQAYPDTLGNWTTGVGHLIKLPDEEYLINTKLKELGYFPMNDETFDNISIQYLEQPVSIDKTKAKHPETGEDVYAAMDFPGDPEGLRKIGYQSDFD